MATLLALTLALATGAAAQAQRPAAMQFFQDPVMGDAVLAPSGEAVALRVRTQDGRTNLAVLDLATQKVKPVAGFNDADVGWVHWLNDQRLLFGATVTQRWSNRRSTGGLYAVNRDGSAYRVITAHDEWVRASDVGRVRLAEGSRWLRSAGAQRDSWIHVAEPDAYKGEHALSYRLARVNTEDGDVQRLESPAPAQTWLLDGAGQPRVAVTARDDKVAVHLRDPDTLKWRVAREFDRFVGNELRPLHVGADGTLYVSAHGGRDTLGLHTLDARSGELSAKPLLVVAGFDIAPQFVATDDKILGVRFEADAEITQWWDEEMKALQARVDKVLDGTVNRLTPPRRGTSPWVQVTSWSDQQPARFYVVHRGTGKLTLLGSARPDIVVSTMGQTDFVRFKARDGLEIPAYVTRPAGSAGRKLPLVVLVHGGPWARGGSWGWDEQTQFLSSRGYAVVAPDFRGSLGYGSTHFRAGLQQWGQAMQDDVADAARWAIAQGIADPKRICVAGASYGGYSALMALVRDGDLFRCGISLVGVTDIDLLFDERWSDVDEVFRTYGLARLVGDREKDAARFKATSPARQAERIKAPVLLAYGRQDGRVPIIHGERMRDALKAHSAKVEYVVYLDEGHGLDKPANRVDFWGRVERFLDQHIGADAK